MTNYFSDRENGAQTRSVDTVDARVWGGIYTLIQGRIRTGAFGYRFPEYCTDPGNENAPCGCDEAAFGLVLAAEVPAVAWPLSADQPPNTSTIMDLLEFCALAVGEPQAIYFHSYMRHNHLRWDRPEGLQLFAEEVNTLFARNALAFELGANGEVRRLLPKAMADTNLH